MRLFDSGQSLMVCASVFLSFSFLWLGLFNIRKHRFLLRSSILVPLVILTAILLSGSIARVLGVLFPVVIPAFLLFFDRASEQREASGRGAPV
jgi:hypothetical protein